MKGIKKLIFALIIFKKIKIIYFNQFIIIYDRIFFHYNEIKHIIFNKGNKHKSKIFMIFQIPLIIIKQLLKFKNLFIYIVVEKIFE
jgi:hypothetical protein